MIPKPSANYMKGRPTKDIFPIEKQKFILNKIKKYVFNNLPPNTKLYRKRIFGSFAKGTFGKYQRKYGGHQYSDIDILFVVDDNFKPPKKWKVHFNCVKKVWMVYDLAEVPIKTKDEIVPVVVQYIVLTKTFASKPETIASAESWGIPLKRSSSKNKFISL